MSLTADHVAGIQRTWALVGQDLKGNGVAFFIAFFKANPSYKDYFEAFRGHTLEELADSPKLRAHATTVMHSLSNCVNNLTDMDCLVVLIKKIAKNHYSKNIRAEHYDNLFKVFVPFLAEKLGSNLDATAAEGWGLVADTMKTLFNQQIEEMDKAAKK